jgi:hypothetical protein
MLFLAAFETVHVELERLSVAVFPLSFGSLPFAERNIRQVAVVAVVLALLQVALSVRAFVDEVAQLVVNASLVASVSCTGIDDAEFDRANRDDGRPWLWSQNRGRQSGWRGRQRSTGEESERVKFIDRVVVNVGVEIQTAFFFDRVSV